MLILNCLGEKISNLLDSELIDVYDVPMLRKGMRKWVPKGFSALGIRATKAG